MDRPPSSKVKLALAAHTPPSFFLFFSVFLPLNHIKDIYIYIIYPTGKKERERESRCIWYFCCSSYQTILVLSKLISDSLDHSRWIYVTSLCVCMYRVEIVGVPLRTSSVCDDRKKTQIRKSFGRGLDWTGAWFGEYGGKMNLTPPFLFFLLLYYLGSCVYEGGEGGTDYCICIVHPFAVLKVKGMNEGMMKKFVSRQKKKKYDKI